RVQEGTGEKNQRLHPESLGSDHHQKWGFGCQNGGKVYDLMKYQKRKQEREIAQAIQKEMDRNIKRRVLGKLSHFPVEIC
ncbi:MAG: hypothetical protein XD91_1769, partial [Clostridiales bacterium 38_11]